jgi:GT2 family glycosyltransferase
VANNIAIRSVRTKYVALLNNDAVPDSQWLNNMVTVLENNPEAGFAASKLLLFNNHNVIDRAGDGYTVAAAGKLRGRGEPSNNYNEPEWIFGACAGAALYRRQIFDDIGLFDEDYFLLYEDVDLSFRAQLNGHKCIFIPDAIVFHKTSSSIGNDDSPVSVYFAHRNLEWTYIHNMPKSLIKKTIVAHLLYNLAAGLFFIARGRGADFIRAKWHALKGLKRALAKRKHIQETRTVSDDYIWSLFEKERLLPRLTRRLLGGKTWS